MSLSVCVCACRWVCVQLCVYVWAYLLLLLSAQGIKTRLVFESAARVFSRTSSSSFGINKKCTAVKFQPSVHVVTVSVCVCVGVAYANDFGVCCFLCPPASAQMKLMVSNSNRVSYVLLLCANFMIILPGERGASASSSCSTLSASSAAAAATSSATSAIPATFSSCRHV